MMKQMILAAGFCSTLAPASAVAEQVGTQVEVLGRTWLVAWADDRPRHVSATRMNLEHQPFRPPAVLSARQAVRAMRAATGCSVNLDSLLRSISGTYYGQLICRK